MPLVTMRQLLDEAAFRDHPGDRDSRGPGKASRRAMKELVAQRMQELGMAGHAQDYEPLTLDQMAARDAAGVGVGAPA